MDRLRSVPFYLMLFVFLAYLGYQYYFFNYDSTGEVELHRAQVAAANSEVAGLRKKVNEGKKFMRTLDQKREEIQAQIKKLAEYQGALSEAPDVPILLKLLDTEAKRAELKVDRIEPGKKDQREYYLDQEFKIEVRGTFQSLLLFIHRITQLQRILRVEGYTFRPSQNSISARASTIGATLSVRAYQYTLSKEDKISVAEAPKEPPKGNLPGKAQDAAPVGAPPTGAPPQSKPKLGQPPKEAGEF